MSMNVSNATELYTLKMVKIISFFPPAPKITNFIYIYFTTLN